MSSTASCISLPHISLSKASHWCIMTWFDSISLGWSVIRIPGDSKSVRVSEAEVREISGSNTSPLLLSPVIPSHTPVLAVLLAHLDGPVLPKQVMSAGSVKTTPRLVEARVGRQSNPTPVLQARPAPPSEGKWLLYDLPGWIHDDNVRACLSCNTKFTLWNRRV